MAVEKGPKQDWTVVADVDLTDDKQFTFVKFKGTDDLVVSVAAVTDRALGVLNNACLKGEEADVTLTAAAQKVRLSGTVARGDDITSSADGHGRKAVAGERVYGLALEPGVSGQVISVALNTINPPTKA